MPIVIFHERGEVPYAYIAKRDLGARMLQVEHDETDCQGGVIALEGGRRYCVNPQSGRPAFPISLHATRSTLL